MASHTELNLSQASSGESSSTQGTPDSVSRIVPLESVPDDSLEQDVPQEHCEVSSSDIVSYGFDSEKPHFSESYYRVQRFLAEKSGLNWDEELRKQREEVQRQREERHVRFRQKEEESRKKMDMIREQCKLLMQEHTESCEAIKKSIDNILNAAKVAYSMAD